MRQSIPPAISILNTVKMCVAVFHTLVLAVEPAFAHTSEQAFVLLLPTGLYITSGVGVVALTVLVVAIMPHGSANLIFVSGRIAAAAQNEWKTLTSLVSFVLLVCLIFIGLTGSPNPVENLLPITVWTIWWMGFVTVQALIGDLWSWFNPWTGPYRLLPERIRNGRFATLPDRIGSWPAVFLFIAFGLFMLADIAPEDPARLARIVVAYWVFTFGCMIVFGAGAWLNRGECFTVLMRRYAQLAIFGRTGAQLRAGVPCWRIKEADPASVSGAVFVLLILGTGSFDGVNETFWWLAMIGINPLEFPGRSAVVWPTSFGYLAANVLLVGLFVLVVGLGLRVAGPGIGFSNAFGLLVLSILPIALGYHVAHYLTAFLVQSQYAAAALNNPLRTGTDIFGFGEFHVTTGFLNTRDSVEIIWLSQAGAVVLGHVLSVLLGHALATRLFDRPRQAILSQLPLALFMILYTLFGLWLLATPRGA